MRAVIMGEHPVLEQAVIPVRVLEAAAALIMAARHLMIMVAARPAATPTQMVQGIIARPRPTKAGA
ncbi:hypothetical protein PPNSA23_40690 [Phyllobacterium phragmitis]|uniref:Uncharacterized protein n=1 Tax=Phyllobacterium phragmitis TaxID=2670329 RepID=A0ABQ0H5H4_9HYPH